jgi:threonylcarbamoyladenosine tRNA methylthiotransferase MtaB
MRRRYTPADYTRAVERVRGAVLHASVTTDVIVGFPGETEEEHQESLRFCEAMGFAAVHVFPYSARPGTTAAHVEPKVDATTKKRRTEEMLALAHETADGYRRRAAGQTRPVLWERLDSWRGEPALSGLTDTYLRVFAKPDERLVNRITPTKLLDGRDGALWGEPLA